MAFVVGALAGGALLMVGASGDDDDEHSQHARRSHKEYGDSALRSQISSKESEIGRKETSVENLRRQMNENFSARINELKREKNYSGLDSSPSKIISSVKADMRRELDKEISQDKQELEAIDKMIARINELELQAKR